jgi:hypothetical protein
MRRLQTRGLFAALENEALVTPPLVEDETVEELPEHAESIEADVGALNEEHADIAENDAAIDEAEETIEALESIREALIEADKEGGLTKAGASILRVSLEHMYQRVGLVIADEKVMPALESFGGAASRQSATQIALETVGEVISSAWAAIVKAAKSAWEWIKSWYAKLFDTNTKVTSRAKALIAAADKLPAGDPDESPIKNENIIKSLKMEGETSIGKAFTALETVSKEFESGASTYFGNLNKLLEEVRAGHSVDLKPEEMSFGLQKAADPSKLGLKIQAGAEVFASEELPGRFHFVSAWGGTTESSFVGLVARKGQGGEGGSLPVLYKEDIKKVGSLCESLSATIAGTKDHLDAAGKSLDLLIKAGESHVQASGEKMSDEGQASVQLARTCHKLITGAATGMNKYLLDTCQALLGWGELSVKAHTGTVAGNAAAKVGEVAGAAKDAVTDAAGKAVASTKEGIGKAAAAVGKAVQPKDKVPPKEKPAV